MGGFEAAKLTFGAAAGARAGWAVGKAVGCLVIIAVLLGIMFLFGVFSKLTTSFKSTPSETVPRSVAASDRSTNNLNTITPQEFRNRCTQSTTQALTELGQPLSTVKPYCDCVLRTFERTHSTEQATESCATTYFPENRAGSPPGITAKTPPARTTVREASGCLDYGYGNGQPIQTLKGVIEKETFPGPPNYESVEKGDKPETYWIFNLDVPICTSGADQRGPSENNVRKLQLLFAQVDMYKAYRSQLAKPVTVTGSLEHAFSGHHHTDVMLQVTKIE
jgi:hypothetical protein